MTTPQPTLDNGRNPFGECESGHQYFRGGCPDCAADQTDAISQGLIA
jgi:hypothetical protein